MQYLRGISLSWLIADRVQQKQAGDWRYCKETLEDRVHETRVSKIYQPDACLHQNNNSDSECRQKGLIASNAVENRWRLAFYWYTLNDYLDNIGRKSGLCPSLFVSHRPSCTHSFDSVANIQWNSLDCHQGPALIFISLMVMNSLNLFSHENLLVYHSVQAYRLANNNPVLQQFMTGHRKTALWLAWQQFGVRPEARKLRLPMLDALLQLAIAVWT